ncbi:hypothetical protein GCM10010987_57810 [Bradyrhizobium guangdongense]|uniref:Uncharacterized protein n=1 Tax=Bradyrhizobium guangdongense TaxID=1325090 RepID=A0AA87WDQ0_9BRAD|nr:hypothetical protein GCM10010987_57810 [Bradyrhizobium guangdongense]
MNDDVVAVVGQHEIETGALELAVEDEVGVGNDDRAIGHMTVGLGGKRIDMAGGGREGTLAIQRKRGVKFASVIQPGTKKRLIFM